MPRPQRTSPIPRWPVGLALAALATSASAQITIGSAGLFRDHEGPNTVGAGSGDNLTVTVRNVSPNLSTFGYASHPALPGVKVPLTNLFPVLRLPVGGALAPLGRPVELLGPALALFSALPWLLAGGFVAAGGGALAARRRRPGGER